MGDPAGKEERGANGWIGHRIRLATNVEMVPHVIDRHDHDHEAANHVDAFEPIGPGGGGSLAYGDYSHRVSAGIRPARMLPSIADRGEPPSCITAASIITVQERR